MADIFSTFNISSSIETLISQLMAIERRPITLLEAERTELNRRRAMFSDLASKLSTLQSQAERLADTTSASVFNGKTVISSDSTVATATATSSATVDNHSIFVSQLAKAHIMVSNRITSSETDIVTNVGTGTKTFRITVNGVQTDVSVTLNSGDDNQAVLEKVASAINAAMEGVTDSVTASVINDTPTTSKLVIRSDQTGLAYKMALEDVDGTLLNYLGIDDESVAATDTAGGYIYADSELDAKFTLDGVEITRSSNTISDVLSGVTINLVGTQEAGEAPITLTVAPDTEAIRNQVESFIEAYNEVLSYLKAKTAVDPANYTRGDLAGDFTYVSLRMRLREMVSDAVSTVVSGHPEMLYQIGITADDDGTLSLSDPDTFTQTLESDVTKVSDLFNSSDGVAVCIDNFIEGFVKVGGVIDDDQSAIDSRIRNIDRRIGRLEERLALREQQYRQELAAMQEALALLAGQQSILSGFYRDLGWYLGYTG